MPICNCCGNEFDIDKEPGALFFSHPSTVKRKASVDKYHICQGCEKKILLTFKHK